MSDVARDNGRPTLAQVVGPVTQDGHTVGGCPNCGVVLPEMEQQQEMILHLERELRGKRAQISRLKNEQGSSGGRNDPYYEDAVKVFGHWREKLAPTAREFSGSRLEKTLARLKAGYTPGELCDSINGYWAFPYIVNRLRERTGKPHERLVELEYIMRDPKNVEAGIELWKRDEGRDSAAMKNGASPMFAQLCDCGHPYAHHLPARLHPVQLEPCCEKGCDCVSFDEINRRADDYLFRRGHIDAPPAAGDIRTPAQKQRQAEAEADAAQLGLWWAQ